MQFLAALALVLLTTASTLAAAKDDALTAAQTFYDGYLKALLKPDGDPTAWVLASKAVTPAFRSAYAKLVEGGLEADPIICGQDFPDRGFDATLPVVTGDSATLTLKSRDPQFDHTFPVTFQLIDGAWLLAGTQDLPAKK